MMNSKFTRHSVSRPSWACLRLSCQGRCGQALWPLPSSSWYGPHHCFSTHTLPNASPHSRSFKNLPTGQDIGFSSLLDPYQCTESNAYNLCIRAYACWQVGPSSLYRYILSAKTRDHCTDRQEFMAGSNEAISRQGSQLLGLHLLPLIFSVHIPLPLACLGPGRACSHRCCSLTQSCLTLCDPMDCSTPGFPVLHYLPEFAETHVHWISDAIQPSRPLSSPSPLALNLSQHQGLLQWVNSLHQVAEVMELQFQHQSFQRMFRVDFLSDWLVWSPCSPRDSQESSPTSQFEGISSSVLSLFYLFIFLLSSCRICTWLMILQPPQNHAITSIGLYGGVGPGRRDFSSSPCLGDRGCWRGLRQYCLSRDLEWPPQATWGEGFPQ